MAIIPLLAGVFGQPPSIIDIIYRLLLGELALKKHTLGDLKSLIDSRLQEQ